MSGHIWHLLIPLSEVDSSVDKPTDILSILITIALKVGFFKEQGLPFGVCSALYDK